MEQLNNNTKKREWKQIDYVKRQKIESLSHAGHNAEFIATQEKVSKRTIERELKQGQVVQRQAKRDFCGDIIGYREYYVYSAV